MKTVIVTRLPSPIHYGDWHDKPLRWEVTDPTKANVQRFAVKAEALTFARFWRQYGFLGAMNTYMALPVDYDYRKSHKSQIKPTTGLCTERGCAIFTSIARRGMKTP